MPARDHSGHMTKSSPIGTFTLKMVGGREVDTKVIEDWVRPGLPRHVLGKRTHVTTPGRVSVRVKAGSGTSGASEVFEGWVGRVRRGIPGHGLGKLTHVATPGRVSVRVRAGRGASGTSEAVEGWIEGVRRGMPVHASACVEDGYGTSEVVEGWVEVVR